MVLDICDSSSVLDSLRIVRLIISFIKIVVPIILIISASLTLARAVRTSENKKAIQSVIRKAIAAVIIFLLPNFIFLIIDLTAGNSDSVIKCLSSATADNIEAARVEEAKLFVESAKASITVGAYNMAYSAVGELDDSSEKTQMLNDLKEVKREIEEVKKEQERMKGTTGVSKSGKYTKAQIIAMTEEQVRAMSNQEFIEFIASAAQIVYKEQGGVLPSITIAQAILESGYGNKFESTSHNVYGLIGYPGDHPKVNRLRKFDNFYEATYYHAAYFKAYSNVYGNFLAQCDAHNAIGATPYLKAYAGGSTSYGSTIATLINQYNLTQYD